MTNRSVAVLQMVSGHDLDQNLADARELLEAASEKGAVAAVLPENFAVLSTRQMLERGLDERAPDGPIRSFLAEQARRLGLWIVGGSVPIAARPDGTALTERVRASCLVFNDKGDQVARYDKIHLFDAQVEDAQGRYRESDTFEPGEDVVTVDTPFGRLGLAICYDLRFPELFRMLREEGAEWITLPSAFTYQTGAAHWHPLVRARAIENQVWMVAAGQGGEHDSKRRTYGHSMIVDPWGSMTVEVSEGMTLALAELDQQRLAMTRERMPVWSHRRLEPHR
ncbi:carbon-nitrogen hydrolase family protein [Marinobacter nanhaiticus D15-8W]|uniref:Carbon-nitrogen hydrolase family protein n=1 Tax=Marinobacter nanhaiticus D15-8W TaxID=626887 RepID=N6WQM8_9GAMM|nr:carbon-nitrogen hydrolase family protein [Marinobacter nanhaiticus]ENO13357.1 carbon-nitrogen hydrolase family protein [Marinobacter nanhaiticus D15-8W]BES70725.1 carbon-nitrogen hydrolase family protein [Marinobacter nanhaiticus D15-8W]